MSLELKKILCCKLPLFSSLGKFDVLWKIAGYPVNTKFKWESFKQENYAEESKGCWIIVLRGDSS